MIIAENRVGRLIEIRTENAIEFSDIPVFRARLATLFQSIPGRVVVCSNLVTTQKVPTDVVNALVTIAKTDNPKIDRHGLLAGSDSELFTQMESVFASANNPNRRIFHSNSGLKSWLKEILTYNEIQRLETFLEI